MMIRKLKTSELIFFLLPIVFLIGIGIFLHGRKAAIIESKIDIQEIKFRLPPKPKAKLPTNVVPLIITFFAGYEGKEPLWWPYDVRSLRLKGTRFVDGQKKEYAVTLFAHSGNFKSYDGQRQNYILEYICNIPFGYDIAQSGDFKGTAIFLDGSSSPKTLGTAQFSVPIQLP